MGCCGSSSTHTTAGTHVALREVKWDGGHETLLGLEVRGVPLDHYLANFMHTSEEQQEWIVDHITEAVLASRESSSASESPVALKNSSPYSDGGNSMVSGHDSTNTQARLTRAASRITRSKTGSQNLCRPRTVHVATLTWNVGGIHDNRKETGAGIEEHTQEDIKNIIAETVTRTQVQADVIVIGLQEVITLSAKNAVKAPSSTKRKKGFGWPETVAQWVELLSNGVNDAIQEDDSNSRDRRPLDSCFSQDYGAELEFDARGSGASALESQIPQQFRYRLYGQPVYLFGMFLCVFAREDVLRQMKDFAFCEMPLDVNRFSVGAKGVVACRFVLYDRSFCFMNCHLNAQNFKVRLEQAERIWNEVKFVSPVDQMVYPVSAHRCVFLIGDTNMRLHRPPISSTKEFAKRVKAMVDECQLAELQEKYDQLSPYLVATKQSNASLCRNINGSGSMMSRLSSMQSMTHKLSKFKLGVAQANSHISVLNMFSEPTPSSGSLSFKPTYKLKVPGPGYNTKRVPAWTDRVLYRSLHARALSYGSVEQAAFLDPPRNLSDHDPVFAGFSVECIPLNASALATLVRNGSREASLLQYDIDRVSPATHTEVMAQQAQDFSENFLRASQVEVEELSIRLFEQLSHYHDVNDTVVGARHVLEFQEDCWRLLCARLEAEIHASLNASRGKKPAPERPTQQQQAISEPLPPKELDQDFQSIPKDEHQMSQQISSPKVSASSSAAANVASQVANQAPSKTPIDQVTHATKSELNGELLRAHLQDVLKKLRTDQEFAEQEPRHVKI